jgi:radical SAM-linked protein
MPRLLFEKKGNAIWISHLDLMRLFQRAFKRAGYALTHTQGFNPRPSVSIALPLSVGVESCCELLDFDLEGDWGSFENLVTKLNNALTEGITVLEAYEKGKKIGELSFLRSIIVFEYDQGVPDGAEEAIKQLLTSSEVTVSKKTKNGIQEQNIAPMIQSIKIAKKSECLLELNVLHCCQNPTLNPMQIALAVEKYLPTFKPSFCKCRRSEVYDSKKQIFR